MLFSLSVLVYMSIIKNAEKKEKKKATRSVIWQHCRPSFLDVVKILPNQQEGTKTAKESIWINQSIYKCTKYIQYIKRAPLSVVFLFLLSREGIIFSQTELADAVEAPQCYEFSTDFVALPPLPRQHPLTSTAPSAGQNGTGVPSAPLTALHGSHTQTFVNCMQQKKQTLPLF